ncbi:MAG: hypothetical protein J6A57_04915, partial [Ruminococcus sp.]|nr:hypothetical protein [Ruminococcus sp.]
LPLSPTVFLSGTLLSLSPFSLPFRFLNFFINLVFLFASYDLYSYDRSKKSGYTKEKSREKGEGDGKRVPEGKPEEGGEFPTFVPVFSSPPSYGCPFGLCKICNIHKYYNRTKNLQCNVKF